MTRTLASATANATVDASCDTRAQVEFRLICGVRGSDIKASSEVERLL